MRVQRLVLGPIDTNCWIASDDDGVPAVVIDPAGDASAILDALRDRPVEAIVLTHGHFDHIGAVAALVEATARSARSCTASTRTP